jgi:hypothetical protein
LSQRRIVEERPVTTVVGSLASTLCTLLMLHCIKSARLTIGVYR